MAIQGVTADSCSSPLVHRDACEKYWGEDLKEMVEERGKRGAGPLVVRPDSGDPPTVVCKVLDILGVYYVCRNACFH